MPVPACLHHTQPTPEVFYSFEDVILMSEGEIIYHGKLSEAVLLLESKRFAF